MNNYFNGAKIYNLYINGKQQENSDDDDFECVNLEFFDEKIFCTYERQLALRNLFKEAFKRMDLSTGRDLVAIYIGYHFFIGQLYNMKCYTDCIQDLENLLPGNGG